MVDQRTDLPILPSHPPRLNKMVSLSQSISCTWGGSWWIVFFYQTNPHSWFGIGPRNLPLNTFSFVLWTDKTSPKCETAAVNQTVIHLQVARAVNWSCFPPNLPLSHFIIQALNSDDRELVEELMAALAVWEPSLDLDYWFGGLPLCLSQWWVWFPSDYPVNELFHWNCKAVSLLWHFRGWTCLLHYQELDRGLYQFCLCIQ